MMVPLLIALTPFKHALASNTFVFFDQTYADANRNLVNTGIDGDPITLTVTPLPVPTPASFWLFGSGLIATGIAYGRRKGAASEGGSKKSSVGLRRLAEFVTTRFRPAFFARNTRSLGNFSIALGLAACSFIACALPASATLIVSCPGCTNATIGGTPVIASPSGLLPSLTLSRNPNVSLPLGESDVTPLVLIPDNAPNGATLNFNVTVSQAAAILGTGTTASCDLPCLAPTLGLATEWSTVGSNFLTDYLGDTQPSGSAIPFDDLLKATRTVDPGANGYFVYTPLAGVPIQFGTGTDAQVSFGGIGSFPAGTILEAFLIDLPSNSQFGGDVSRDLTGSAVFVGATNVPEPSTLLLMLASFMAVFVVRRRGPATYWPVLDFKPGRSSTCTSTCQMPAG